MIDALPKKSIFYHEIIQQLYYGKLLSCADLSLRLDKSIPLVTKALNQLIESGYVTEHGYAPSSGGRRPLMYGVKEDRMYIVTVAMDQLSTRISIVDLLNNFVSPLEIIELPLLDNPDALNQLVSIVNHHIGQSGISKGKIIGVGIGMPGLVNIYEGANYSYLPTGGPESLSSYLGNAIDLPVYIDNDSSLIALAELKFGQAKMEKDTMVINLSWGIGLGMILNGQLFRGHSGFAGEFSHIPISQEGKLCYCGKQGCLEAEASLVAMAEKALKGIEAGKVSGMHQLVKEGKLSAGNALMQAALQGDQYAIEILSEGAYKIGRGLSILIHIMNPVRIVLSGRGSKLGKLVLPPIQQALNKYCIPRLSDLTQISVSEIGEDAELLGAAIWVMENFGLAKNHLLKQ